LQDAVVTGIEPWLERDVVVGNERAMLVTYGASSPWEPTVAHSGKLSGLWCAAANAATSIRLSGCRLSAVHRSGFPTGGRGWPLVSQKSFGPHRVTQQG
jgi:hypothetical protein